MRNLFSIFGISYAPAPKGDARRASYSAVPADRGTSGGRRLSYGANRRQSLDPAAVLGRHLFDGRIADPRTRNTSTMHVASREQSQTQSLFSDLRTMSGTALMYMLANMFLTQLFYVVGVGGVQEDNLCLCLAFGIHYLRLAVISWLCVMTYDMLITFRNNVNLNPRPEPVNVLISRFVKYSLFAWGVPSLSVISASIMRVTVNHRSVNNLNPYNCWFFEKTIYNVTFAVPALCCFAAIADSLARSWLTARATVGLQVDKKTRLKMHRKRTLQLHLYVKIATLLFAVNVFGYVARNGSPASDPVAWIAYNVGHSLQGILVALAVTCNCQVLKIYTRSFARRRRRRPRNGSATALFDKRDSDISDTTYLQNLTWDPVPLPV